MAEISRITSCERKFVTEQRKCTAELQWNQHKNTSKNAGEKTEGVHENMMEKVAPKNDFKMGVVTHQGSLVLSQQCLQTSNTG